MTDEPFDGELPVEPTEPVDETPEVETLTEDPPVGDNSGEGDEAAGGDDGGVQQLRDEVERLREQLWTARVEATGRLVDASDLPLDPDALDDPQAVAAAVDALIDRKPHLARRTARGDIGQHEQPTTEPFSLHAALRAGI